MGDLLMNYSLKNIEKNIEKLKKDDFELKELTNTYEIIFDRKIKCCGLLRRALLLIYSISCIEDDLKQEKITLYKKLDDIMKNKLKELNPNFDEVTLNHMISSYNRGIIIFPIDIIVIDKAVFHTEGILDDSLGFIYEINTLMFKYIKNSQNPYHNIFDEDFIFDTEKYVISYDRDLTMEEFNSTAEFISKQINSICKKNITKPQNGELTKGNDKGINVFFNTRLDDIALSIKKKQECDIKFCTQCYNDDTLLSDDITLYIIHQSFNGDIPVWTVTKKDKNVWRLTENVSKNKKESIPKVKTLSPTPKNKS